MRNKNLCLDLFTERMAGVQAWRSAQEEKDLEYRSMLKALRKAAEGELTERQRQCIRLCYYEGLTARDAARKLGINESTVSRHLKKARNRLACVLRYSFPRLNEKY
ncbi:Sigma-70 family RNA polymerase sigma factor [Ruminococcaceae bacterium BL-6]|nr:Sigma-70 family RNA polymerase sigma factor [Ruminococcaceae bacterium BL-6]